jgi:hypothetical protein
VQSGTVEPGFAAHSCRNERFRGSLDGVSSEPVLKELRNMSHGPDEAAESTDGTSGAEAAADNVEECIDELDEFITGLGRYTVPVLACALRVHLGGLLRAMVEARICTRENARQFVLELEQEALGVE